MPRGPKISLATRREWLEAYEWGESIGTIAGKYRRTTRTVKEHIELARQEQEQQQVRAGLLREAYQKHWDDLLDLVQELRKRSQAADPRGLWGAPGLRTVLLLQALRSHTRKSELWKVCEEWEEHARRLDAITKEIRDSILERAKQEVEKDFQEAIADGFLESLLFAIQQAARGAGLSHMEYKLEKTAEGLRLMWGGYGLAEKIADEARRREVEERHKGLVCGLAGPDSSLVSRVREALGLWQRARDAIEREAETLLLRHMLPGRCPLCPGSEGAKTPRPRTRRKGL